MANLVDRQFRRQYRKKHKLDTRLAFLGDGNNPARVRVPGRAEMVYIQYPASGGNTNNLGWPTVVKMDINLTDAAGIGVIIGIDDEGDVAVLKLSSKSAASGGNNPAPNTPGNALNQWVDLNQSPLLRVQPMGAGAPLYLSMLGVPYIDKDGVVHDFRGISGGMNISSFLPASPGEWRLIAPWKKSDDTHEITGSTAQSQSDPFDVTDLQELVDAASLDSMPSSVWIARYGQTIFADTDKYMDWRQWLNIPGDAVATLTTTDATQTTLASIAVAEASLLTLTGTFSGVKDDYSAAISGTFVAGVRRATAGSAILVGVTVTSNEDHAGTPALTVDANSNNARVRVTGIAAENWNWEVKYKTLIS